MSLDVFKCTKIYLDEYCQAVKGVKGGFTTFFIVILALRCLSQNVGTFQVKRLSVLVKTLRRFFVDDVIFSFLFYFDCP